MRASIALLLFFILNIGYALNNNTILALVNDSFISSQSIEKYLSKSSSFDDKMAIIDYQIDIILQLEKVHELGINASQYDINEAITELAISNKITIEQLKDPNRVFSNLMGDDVEPRREFILKNAQYVQNIDI